MHNTLTVIFICLSLIAYASSEVRFVTEEFANTTFYAPRIYNALRDYENFGPIVGNLTTNAENVNGNIAVVFDNVTTGDLYKLQQRDAIAVIRITTWEVPGSFYCIFSLPDYNFTLPMVELYWADVIDVVLQRESVVVSITSDDNPWYEMNNSIPYIVLFRGGLGAIGLVAIIFASVKLAKSIEAQGSQFNMTQVCLALEIIANLLRIFFVAADPFGCEPAIGYAVGVVFLTLSIPFNLSTFMLVTFYWHEAMTESSVQIYSFLHKCRIPFYVITGVLITGQVAMAALAFSGFPSVFALMAVFLVVSLIFLIFYTITAIKITRKIKLSMQMSSAGPDKVKQLRKTTGKMIVGGVFRLALIVCGVIYAFVRVIVEGNPIYRTATWAVIYVLLYLDSGARIYLFDIRKGKSGSSTTNSNSSKKRSTQNQS